MTRDAAYCECGALTENRTGVCDRCRADQRERDRDARADAERDERMGK